MVSRRLLAFVFACATRAGYAQGLDAEVSVKIRIDDAVEATIPPIALQRLRQENDTSAEAQALAASAPNTRGIPIIAWIVGPMVVSLVARTVQELLRQHWYGGVIVDTRSTPITITSSKAVPGDVIIVIEQNGQTKQYKAGVSDTPAWSDILKK